MIALGPRVMRYERPGSGTGCQLFRLSPPYPLFLDKLGSGWQLDDVEPLTYFVQRDVDQITIHAVEGHPDVVLDFLATAAKVKRNYVRPVPLDFDPPLCTWWREWVERFLADEFGLSEDDGATLTVVEMEIQSR